MICDFCPGIVGAKMVHHEFSVDLNKPLVFQVRFVVVVVFLLIVVVAAGYHFELIYNVVSLIVFAYMIFI